MEKLIEWPKQGWSVVGDLRGDKYLALSVNGSTDASGHEWHLTVIEDDTERAVEFATLLTYLREAEIVQTDHLSGIVVDVTEEFDWEGEGPVRGLYTLASDDTEDTYIAYGDTVDELRQKMLDYSEPDPEDTE